MGFNGFPYIYLIRCNPILVLIFVKSGRKSCMKSEKSREKFWWFGKKQYLCTR